MKIQFLGFIPFIIVYFGAGYFAFIEKDGDAENLFYMITAFLVIVSFLWALSGFISK